MTNNLEDEVKRIVERMDNQENQEQEQDTQTPQEDIQDMYVLIVREQEEEGEPTQVVDSTPITPQKPSLLPAYLAVSAYLLLLLSTIMFQVWVLFNPPTVTVSILPKSQTVTFTDTLPLGRILSPFTLSQSQTTATTGKGHQSAKAAIGYLTFYNGQFQSVFIAAGTVLTGASGIKVVTDQDATIPQAYPPVFGQISVSAHAINTGVRGNIPAYDIDQACCATSVLAKNVQPFHGGQEEQYFSTVSTQDITKLSTSLKTSLSQSVAGAFQGQVKPQEQLHLLPCTPTVSSDHQMGQEATFVKVTVSQTCSAVAYNSQEVETKATAFLSTQALQKLGTGYRLFGTIHVSVTQATVTNTAQVFLSFHAQRVFVYAVSLTEQQRIKSLITGKTKQEAARLLALLPGIERASLSWDGFGDDTKLPRNPHNIHIVLFYAAGG